MPGKRLQQREVSRDRRYHLLVAILGGLLAVNCTFTMFNVALVRIAGSLHTTQNTLTWAITGPLLVVGVAGPPLGKRGDIHGHRRNYLMGMAGSLVCAALTAAAWSASSLIVARLFAGFGDACMMASSWALMFRVFRPEERTKIMGWWALIGAGGPVIGVAIGGPVVQAVGWRWVFIGQAPLIAIALVASYRLLPDTSRQEGGRVNWGSAIALAVGVGGLLLGLNQGGVAGWLSPRVLVPLACVPIGFTSFAIIERRSDHPLVPLEWLRKRSFVLPSLATLLINFCYMGGFYLSPLFLERALGYGIGVTGVMQVARPLVFAVSAPVAGYLATRTGERAAAMAGATAMAGSMLLFAAVGVGVPGVLVVVALGLSGLANGVASPSLGACVANSVEVDQMGTASAALQVFSQVGVVAGIQVMETVEVARSHAGLIASFHDAYLVGAFVAVLGVVCGALMRSVRRRSRVVTPADEVLEALVAAPEPSLG